MLAETDANVSVGLAVNFAGRKEKKIDNDSFVARLLMLSFVFQLRLAGFLALLFILLLFLCGDCCLSFFLFLFFFPLFVLFVFCFLFFGFF